VVGEVVFNTGMTGYVETLTDPSYSGQILTFTYPLIGNYGVPDPETWESGGMHLRGVIVSELTADWSHATGLQSLLEWLQEQKVPVIMGVDTRALTKKLREHGVMAGLVTSEVSTTLPEYVAPAIVSVPEPKVYNPTGKKTVVAVDCGLKENIVRNLVALDYRVVRVPHNYDYTTEKYDGVLLSNGPGDPTDYTSTIEILQRAMQGSKPIFGICLGSQLMGLAAGAKTYKLLYGHRGHNQPAITPDGRAYITSQNHGYAIDEASLPKGWDVTFRNLNDNSVEGIAHTSKPFSAVQFHPEATPGPTDTNWLFAEFGQQLAESGRR
jgi:carbamoyl-phosphate synthase small subunit